MSLPDLPVELQDLIITGLHPTAALALSKTNHFYHSVVSLDRLDPDIVSRFLYELENRPSNLNKDFYHKKFACYKCLSLKPVLQFASLGSDSFDGRNARYRQCVQCDVRDGSVMPGDPYRTYLLNDYIVCIECLDSRVLFCAKCRSCARCLEEKGVTYCGTCWWCHACVESKPSVWRSEVFRLYSKDTSRGFAVKLAHKHRASESHSR